MININCCILQLKLLGLQADFDMNRRRYIAAKSPRNQFIHTSHLNQVPLPYYNPLQDPFLSGFFSNYHVSKLISQRGLIYKPREEYPYDERRESNFNKFLRNNSYMIPSGHLRHNREDSLKKAKTSRGEQVSEYQSNRSQLAKRMSDSDFFSKSNGKFTDTSSRMPSARGVSQSSDRLQRIIKYRGRHQRQI